MTDVADDVLVLGVGNDLRADDAAGRRVAEAIERLHLHDVEVRSQSQLTPELAELVAGRRLVVFVDADVDVERVTVAPVVPDASSRTVMAHHGHPGGVLALVDVVGRQPDRALLVSVPARDLDLGDRLSPATAAAVAEAVDVVHGLVTGVA